MERAGDDARLVDRLRRGDPRAFEDLVITHQHRVFGVALRMLGSRAEAEEAAQEVFLRAHRALADFRGDDVERCVKRADAQVLESRVPQLWALRIKRGRVTDHAREELFANGSRIQAVRQARLDGRDSQ